MNEQEIDWTRCMFCGAPRTGGIVCHDCSIFMRNYEPDRYKEKHGGSEVHSIAHGALMAAALCGLKGEAVRDFARRVIERDLLHYQHLHEEVKEMRRRPTE